MNMNIFLIFLWIILGFVSMSFWEAYVEGKYPWAGRQVGWKIKMTKHISLTAYHFWVYIMFIFFLGLPFLIEGWDTKLFGIILSATCLGLIVEDFLWFIINPFYSLKKFNPKDVYWYPWLNLKIISIPVPYIASISVSVLSWYFLWR